MFLESKNSLGSRCLSSSWTLSQPKTRQSSLLTCLAGARFVNRRFNLSKYYVSELDRDYICSQSHESGMSKCDDLPPYVYRGQQCNLSATDVELPWNGTDTSTPPDTGCINWNQYYSSCRPVGNNPFLGAVSFDNIGLAWVAIFQVRKWPLCISRNCHSLAEQIFFKLLFYLFPVMLILVWS